MIPDDLRAHENRWVPGERPWWAELWHPLPLGAAALLFTNDHLLKGAGLLPGAVTGKLSDFAGLFVFPVLVVASVRWVFARAGQPLSARRTGLLVGSVVAATGLSFTAIKLVPAVNRLACAVLGPNSMDATDLVALSALAAAWVWMHRRAAANRDAPATARDPDSGGFTDLLDSSGSVHSPAPPRLRGVAAGLVALACAATSAPAQPPRPPEAQPVRPAPRRQACAVVTPVTCRYDAARYSVRFSARKPAEGACAVRVGHVYSVPQEGDDMPVAENPIVDLGDKDAALFGAWGRIVLLPAAAPPPATAPLPVATVLPTAPHPTTTPIPSAATAGPAAPQTKKVRVLVQQHGTDPEGPMTDDSLVEMVCRLGFGEDTEPPAQVAR